MSPRGTVLPGAQSLPAPARAALVEAVGSAAEGLSLTARWESKLKLSVRWRDGQVESLGLADCSGGRISSDAGGKRGLVSFTDPTAAAGAVAAAISHSSRHSGPLGPSLAPLAPLVAEVATPDYDQSGGVPLEARLELLDWLGRVLLQEAPALASAAIAYVEERSEVLTVASPQRVITARTDYMDFSVTARVEARGRAGNATRQVGTTAGLPDAARAFEAAAREAARAAQSRASRLKPVSPGRYCVVLAPAATGALAHEIVGHLCEADMGGVPAGLKVAAALSITDDPTRAGAAGSYAFDDEGVEGGPIRLVSAGSFIGRLHTRRTAALTGQRPTGHARSALYHHWPLARVSCTFVEPGNVAPDELISDVGRGIYAVTSPSGGLEGDAFRLVIEEAYEIVRGRVCMPLEPLALCGSLGDALCRVDAVGSDFALAGGLRCSKWGQGPLRVSMGGPHLRLQGVFAL